MLIEVLQSGTPPWDDEYLVWVDTGEVVVSLMHQGANLPTNERDYAGIGWWVLVTNQEDVTEERHFTVLDDAARFAARAVPQG